MYDRLDPIGTWREDFRMAYTLAFLQNVVTSLYAKKGETPKKYSAQDFMPKWGMEETGDVTENVDTQENLVFALKTWAKRHNKLYDKAQAKIKNTPPSIVPEKRSMHKKI